jgi:DNA-binding response OmpR family regulator
MPSILIVEDEVLAALMYQSEFEDAGWDVVGPAFGVARALELLAVHTPDAAVLDVNLQGELCWPVAQALHTRRIPFVFATAYRSWAEQAPNCLKGYGCVDKPVDLTRLLARLEAMLPNGAATAMSAR